MLIHDTGNLASVRADYNILWSPNTDDVVIWPPDNVDTVAEYQQSNLYGWGAQSMQSDPQLMDPWDEDFQLTKISPAVDSGSDEHAPLDDVNGTARPRDGNRDGVTRSDRGAYERDTRIRNGADVIPRRVAPITAR